MVYECCLLNIYLYKNMPMIYSILSYHDAGPLNFNMREGGLVLKISWLIV